MASRFDMIESSARESRPGLGHGATSECVVRVPRCDIRNACEIRSIRSVCQFACIAYVKRRMRLTPRRRSETREENRTRLLSAARRAFAAKGFVAASMDELTAEAGLTRGALYHNFGDKTGLLAAVVAEVDGEM